MHLLADSLAGQAGVLLELVSASIAPTLAEFGLTESAFELISTIDAAGPNPTHGLIAQRLGVSPPTLTELVRISRERGWIEQVPSPIDARRKTLHVTEQGRVALRAVVARVEEVEQEMITSVPAADLAQCRRVLQSVNRNLARSLANSRSHLAS
ncbi:MAG: MarR family winged helix-turn-helix transcriptional regulator [Fimbriimonas sp.]